MEKGLVCPKCGSVQIKVKGCCGGQRWHCLTCGFNAPKKYFKSGKLPSQQKKKSSLVKQNETLRKKEKNIMKGRDLTGKMKIKSVEPFMSYKPWKKKKKEEKK